MRNAGKKDHILHDEEFKVRNSLTGNGTGTRASPTSALVDAAFHAIEEVNEITSAAGWDGEFRQLSKGRVTSMWRSLHLGSCSLTSHSLDKRIHVRQVPPRGCMALGIPRPPHFLQVDGAEVRNNEVVLMHVDSQTEFVTPNEAACETLTVPRSVFEASKRALFPRMRINGGATSVFQCATSGWSALQRESTRLLRDGRMSPEDVSNLLCRFLELMAGEPKELLGGAILGNMSIRRVARRAQEYIEEHYAGTIRLEDLCRCTGVSLRTLQRYFSDYFQVSPFQYIKASRLNAARRALVTSAPSRDEVTRIALNNGFTHLGRFSVNYREHFGESPKVTLARGALHRAAIHIATRGEYSHIMR